MDLFTALVKFAVLMLVAGAAFMVIASLIASSPWYKRIWNIPARLDDGLGPYAGAAGHTHKKSRNEESDGDSSGETGGDGE